MKKSIIVMCALLATSVAGASEFDMPAAACTPDAPAIQNNRYTITGSGAVTHAGAQTGLITLYCPLSATISAPGNMEITWKSDLADVLNNYVNVSYIKMAKSTGAISQVKFESSTSGTNNNTVQVTSGTFTDTYNQSAYVYYVRVDLMRSSTAHSVTFYKVTVW